MVLLSVPEGEEKPLKYPGIFFKSKLLVVTKLDLLPYVPFSLDEAMANARTIHPGIEILQLSSTTGQGMGEWLKWIEKR